MLKTYSEREEKWNYLTHAFGVLIAVVATVILLRKSIKADNGWATVAFFIYGFGMLACMLSSTIYHYVNKPGIKKTMRRFDHGNIYVLIAASFSPITLILLREEGMWGWGLFTLIWFFALIGILLNFGRIKKNNNLKTASYVLMGLSMLIAIKPLINIVVLNDCVAVLYWIGIGGIFYIAGAFIYALTKHEFIHTLFHLFVLLGLISHIISAYLIPL
ncbi:MAG TPA: hemolysin III family protein [Bacteroidaceae bacterium]|nr:hemolysin III family protein [Bacteroidaceae bacterium]